MLGLTLFGIGMGLVIALSSLSSSEFSYILPLIVAGIGLGCTFAPMTTVTMRRVDPRLAGAASGILNTIRQLGGAFGSAIVGAILQNRLASELVSQAQVQAGNLPAPYRSQFVQGFASAGNGVLEVGRGQSGVALPSGLPAQAVAKITQVAHDVFASAYLNAMRPALAVPIGVLLVGALLTTMIVRRKNYVEPARQAAAVTG
jgi:hypothetical protein